MGHAVVWLSANWQSLCLTISSAYFVYTQFSSGFGSKSKLQEDDTHLPKVGLPADGKVRAAGFCTPHIQACGTKNMHGGATATDTA